MIDPEISKAIAIIESQMAEKDQKIADLERQLVDLNLKVSRLLTALKGI